MSSSLHRQKVRNLQRNHWAALHVELGHFWAWTVLEGTAVVSDPPESIEDNRVAALLAFYRQLYKVIDEEALAREMVADSRVLLRLHVGRSYGNISQPRELPARTDMTERI